MLMRTLGQFTLVLRIVFCNILYVNILQLQLQQAWKKKSVPSGMFLWHRSASQNSSRRVLRAEKSN
ncbi:hypothetical protein BDV23DRAFT_157348 [Aspergillus alliaceus]|uniref:Uncharacterized protein n=1 Tax=Petromyces alliaceus TaxID=209559 RepID=A0A5N7C5F4_PETAA|nr:hypothetical protein BDV23DRAFT_157348 [Aspergillus alliaceus]